MVGGMGPKCPFQGRTGAGEVHLRREGLSGLEPNVGAMSSQFLGTHLFINPESGRGCRNCALRRGRDRRMPSTSWTSWEKEVKRLLETLARQQVHSLTHGSRSVCNLVVLMRRYRQRRWCRRRMRRWRRRRYRRPRRLRTRKRREAVCWTRMPS